MNFGDARGNQMADFLSLLRPVGSTYESVLPTNPAELFGFGTWIPFAEGRTVIGVNPSDPDFDAAEKTGGAKTVTLSANEMPSHTHVQDQHGHGVTDPGHAHIENSNNTSTGALRGWGAPDTSTNQSTATGYSTAPATTGLTVNNATATNQNTGGGQAHNNLPPYTTAYKWVRIA